MSRTTAVNTVAAVAVTSTSVLVANPGRRQFTIVNYSANQVSLNLGAGAAVAGSGVVLVAGASYTDNLWEGAVTAIALTGTSNVSVCEY